MSRVGLTRCAPALLALVACAAASVALLAQPAAYEVVAVADGGAISGRVTWVGDLPPVLKLPVTKDAEICCPGAADKVSPRLQVSAAKGVKDTVVYLEEIAQGKGFPAGATFRIDQKACEYLPHILIAPKGADLEVGSSDDVLHNVHLTGAANGNVALPDAKSKPGILKLKKAGRVEISCDNGHVWMSGTVMVVTHPYYAVTDEDGKFTLADVPPGAYKLSAWHEGWQVAKTDEKDGVVTRYVWSEPIKLTQAVEVKAKAAAEVTFELGAPAK
ncbi:MAG: hypothetical protein HZA54_12790 [Planctomycetes bacterium]|nr:hypothetical protein [Planctomycetota bacterium]